ncbi:MAG: RhuM family protein [Chlamydiia bacterium]
MGLTNWNGIRVRQKELTMAKNYLNQAELEELNQILVIYLDYPEIQAKRRKMMTIREWEDKLDTFLTFHEKDLLTHAATLSAQIGEQLPVERYVTFNRKWIEEQRLHPDAEEISLLEAIQGKASSSEVLSEK